MSVRSHYTRDSYMNRPLHARDSRRNAEPEPKPEYEDNAPCEACKNCEYKQLVETAMMEDEREREQQEPIGYKIQHPKARASMQVPQPQRPSYEYREGVEKKPEGILKRFSNYVAKNQAANRAAGDTSLMEDLAKWGGNISAGAAKLGEEEISGLDRKKASTGNRDPRKDDDLVDFLTGKKARK